jgi:hypothetical protein
MVKSLQLICSRAKMETYKFARRFHTTTRDVIEARQTICIKAIDPKIPAGATRTPCAKISIWTIHPSRSALPQVPPLAQLVDFLPAAEIHKEVVDCGAKVIRQFVVSIITPCSLECGSAEAFQLQILNSKMYTQ